jgi:hypothetical protein
MLAYLNDGAQSQSVLRTSYPALGLADKLGEASGP